MTNRALAGLEALTEEVDRNVSSISANLEVITKNSDNAGKLGRAAETAAEAAVNVLSHLMSRLCATADKLRVLQNNLTLLNADAKSMKKSVSWDETQYIAALKNVSGSSDMLPYVDEGFAFAVRMTALLDRELERSKTQIEKVTASYGTAKLGRVDAGKSAHDAVRDAVAKGFAGTHEQPSEDVCAANATSELVQKLRGSSADPSLLGNASAIAALSSFAMGMNDELAIAAKRVSTATVRAAEANKALAEAVRRAREEAAWRRCPPLYRQLLSALSGKW
ncbi:hypothetical protein, conserved in T.vivax [Trypanosoma vivax Y486]|uniref:Uncharacterized protein n=1 Tax=Trypanosoma vivax (strain Y486) TaxID=1055687 RepID=F9WTX8_TRYVY|nr:hypothetical protein, conserved in T.vivax [Trypanosoma vivax Y486]|eukprot:CCD21024.1 hypothetical protein, conserved in T.vivax [Trypanosoma vivax Y486]